MPPKFLNIPGIGVERPTAPAFGANLARRMPKDIELDAELGMPLDLLGLPGIFEGDESCMFAREVVRGWTHC
jgi:RNA polymerase II-associated factor 1